MAKTRISVYVDDDLHRKLKASASLLGMSLSDFMVEAAQRMLNTPNRGAAASAMEKVRTSVANKFSVSEILTLREEGRRP